MRAGTATQEELEMKRQALINAETNSISSQIPSCDNESGGPSRLVHYAGPADQEAEIIESKAQSNGTSHRQDKLIQQQQQ